MARRVSASRRTPPPQLSAYLIEPQTVFLPHLRVLLTQAGMTAVAADGDMDLLRLFEMQPDVLLIDLDFRHDPLETIRAARLVLPVAKIAVVTGERHPGWSRQCHEAGADCVVAKAASELELVFALRSLVRTGHYTDWRVDVA